MTKSPNLRLLLWKLLSLPRSRRNNSADAVANQTNIDRLISQNNRIFAAPNPLGVDLDLSLPELIEMLLKPPCPISSLSSSTRASSETPAVILGPSKEYNVDMIPKFMMTNWTLVCVLVHTNVIFTRGA